MRLRSLARSFVPLCWAADTAGVGAASPASSLSLGGSRRDLSKLGQDCAKGFARAPRGLMHCRESERVPQCVFVCVCVWESEARQVEVRRVEERRGTARCLSQVASQVASQLSAELVSLRFVIGVVQLGSGIN